MDTELMLDVGQANEFKLACRRAGYTNADIKKMCEGSVLAQVLPVVRGNGEVTVVRHLIDCDADPFTRDGWRVEEHKKHGREFDWDEGKKINLYLSQNQQDGKVIRGNKLRTELSKKAALNANVLDYLLAHPDLIPEGWNGKAIFFWGTIYRYSDGDLCVRCLCFGGGRWRWDDDWLGGGWGDLDPAALLAS